jgi:hypothetical protein
LGSNIRSRYDIRGDPQLRERNPQLIPNISQVVGPLKAYIRRLSHGGKVHDRGNNWRYETYDLIGKIQKNDKGKRYQTYDPISGT